VKSRTVILLGLAGATAVVVGRAVVRRHKRLELSRALDEAPGFTADDFIRGRALDLEDLLE
jgi:hypothetical protein